MVSKYALYLRLGRELELSSRFSAALAHHKEIEQRASECGDCVLELAALTVLSDSLHPHVAIRSGTGRTVSQKSAGR